VRPPHHNADSAATPEESSSAKMASMQLNGAVGEKTKDELYQEQLSRRKAADDLAALEKLHSMSDQEKIAMHEKEVHDKQNPFRRPSMIKGKLGIYTGTSSKNLKKRVLGGGGSVRALGGSSHNLKGKTPSPTNKKTGPAPAALLDSSDEEGDGDDDGILPIHRDSGAGGYGAADYEVETLEGTEKVVLRGPVYEQRTRGTKKIWKEGGFRKLVWKQVCLVLREGSLEIFKTDEAEKSHHYTGLADILEVGRSETAEGGGFHCSLISGETMELRAASESEADGWVASICHNAGL
jgi:hypothetical protein